MKKLADSAVRVPIRVPLRLGRRFEAIVFVPKACAAERPLLRCFHQTRFHRIRFDVVDHFPVMRFIPNVAIPIIVLPKLAASPQEAVDAPGRETFPVLDELRLWLLPNLDEQVDVPEKYGGTLALTPALSPRGEGGSFAVFWNDLSQS